MMVIGFSEIQDLAKARFISVCTLRPITNEGVLAPPGAILHKFTRHGRHGTQCSALRRISRKVVAVEARAAVAATDSSQL